MFIVISEVVKSLKFVVKKLLTKIYKLRPPVGNIRGWTERIFRATSCGFRVVLFSSIDLCGENNGWISLLGSEAGGRKGGEVERH